MQEEWCQIQSFSKTRKRIHVIAVLGILILFLVLGMGIYLNDYYRAEELAWQCMEYPPEEVTVTQKDHLLVFEPESPTCGIIFYPGGKVEPESYAPLMVELAEKGILSVVVKMPGNLAVFDSNGAEGLQQEFPQVGSWYMAGHSLGGSMAASYLGGTSEVFEGLILLAAYSTVDLSDTDVAVLSIYGEKDGVLNMEKYHTYKNKLPSDYEELVIEGGCHAYFGVYGSQEGDGLPEITVEEQMDITAEAIATFLQKDAKISLQMENYYENH